MKVKASRKKVVIPPNTELCEWEKIRSLIMYFIWFFLLYMISFKLKRIGF